MKKKFLLDTNVLMRNPNAVFKFEENEVFISSVTLRELDKYKTRMGEAGYNAREAIRIIFSLQDGNDTLSNIPINSGRGTFSIVSSSCVGVSDDFLQAVMPTPDDYIIATAKEIKAILITSDIAMYLKAKTCGCNAEIFNNEQASQKTLEYTGRRNLLLPNTFISDLYKLKKMELPEEAASMHPNEYAIIKDSFGSSQSVIARRRGDELVLVSNEIHPYRINARNVGQICALDALMAPVDEIPLVFLIGPAGTAKTFLSMAAGLQQVEDKNYTRMLLLRPNTKFDDDIGYLKGDEMEKITPLLRPCLDNLEAIITPTIETTDYAREKVNCLFSKGIIEGEALAYIRGRSIANNFVVVDEAQNSTPTQMLGIISRAGSDSKFVVTGDVEQIDNPRVDKKNNGLVFAAEKMMDSNLCAQVGFVKEECVRSPLAAEASKLLSI